MRNVTGTMPLRALGLAFASLALLGEATPDALATSPALSGEQIFARAKSAWRARVDPAYVTYGLLERYTWRDRVHDNWWQGAYRDGDRALVLHRQLVPEQEAARMKGSPIKLNLRFHRNDARGDSLDTNPDADAFPILDPMIEPDASFGLDRREPRAALVGGRAPRSDAPPETVAPSPTPTPAPSPASTGAPAEKPLRVLATVEAVSRDYRIELAGTERVRDASTYHLTLTPVRDPRAYRLRDLWVETKTFATVRLAVQGLFDGRPYDDARWTVTFVPIDGHYYVQQVKTDETLRFGLDRYVAGLEYDFVQYAFPVALPDVTFRRLL